MALLLMTFSATVAEGGQAPPRPVTEDSLPEPLTSTPGSATRGREIVTGRDGNCVLCHALPGRDVRFVSNVGPSLSGVATRLDAGRIRLRVVDPTRINPAVTMPSYYRLEGLDQVAQAYQGKPILTAQQIEDVVAYLLTLN